MQPKRSAYLLALLVLIGLALVACGGGATPAPAVEEPAVEEPAAEEPAAEEPAAEEPAAEEMMELSGDVVVDGSSTVYPITTAVAEEFALVYPDVRVSVGLSGTGGGFKKFCVGETDISDASRPIKDEERATCEENGVEFAEFLVAYDGLSVMVNPGNDFVECLSVEQLGNIMRPDSEIFTWADINPDWPAETIRLFVPDPDSGTRDYFIEAVLDGGLKLPEELLDIRQDDQTTFSSDDNVLLDGIANEEYALGFFGYAYYIANPEAVKLVAVENKAGECILPSDATVQDGTYNPLSRPLFIYVNLASLAEKAQLAEFVRFYLSPEGAAYVMSDVGYSLPPDGTYEEGLALLADLLGE